MAIDDTKTPGRLRAAPGDWIGPDPWRLLRQQATYLHSDLPTEMPAYRSRNRCAV